MYRINDLSSWLLIFLFIVISHGCTEKSNSEQELDNITKAINNIEDRKQAEIYIIKENTNFLQVLELNYDQANSDGMREKISREISIKESVLAKAELNRRNQDKILEQLNSKRDSLKNLLDKSTE